MLGDTVNITAAKIVGGNPLPTTSWFGPAAPSDQVALEGRFSQPTRGTLQIENLRTNDFGNYTFTASNGVGSSAEHTVSLIRLSELLYKMYQHNSVYSHIVITKVFTIFYYNELCLIHD